MDLKILFHTSGNLSTPFYHTAKQDKHAKQDKRDKRDKRYKIYNKFIKHY